MGCQYWMGGLKYAMRTWSGIKFAMISGTEFDATTVCRQLGWSPVGSIINDIEIDYNFHFIFNRFSGCERRISITAVSRFKWQ